MMRAWKIHLYPIAISIAVLSIGLGDTSAYAQWKPDPKKNVVIETSDGLVLVGTIASNEDHRIQLNTVYGDLSIGIPKIVRIDGDTLDADGTIVREQSVTIKSSGNVILDYLFPISANHATDKVQILVPGKVLSIRDHDRRKLMFTSKPIGDFSRCTVNLPTHQMSSVRVEVLLENEAVYQEGRWRYVYRYLPRTEQTFRLHLTLPTGASDIQASPDIVQHVSNTLLWQETLARQSNTTFDLSYRLDGN